MRFHKKKLQYPKNLSKFPIWGREIYRGFPKKLESESDDLSENRLSLLKKFPHLENNY